MGGMVEAVITIQTRPSHASEESRLSSTLGTEPRETDRSSAQIQNGGAGLPVCTASLAARAEAPGKGV